VLTHRRATGSLRDFPGAEWIVDPDQILERDCDILIPAAMEHQIRRDNAPRIRARLIAEGANGPIAAEADAILSDAGCVVIPDIYANAGGVVVSYFEWVKNLHHMSFERLTRRHERMTNRRLVRAMEGLAGRSIEAPLAEWASIPVQMRFTKAFQRTLIERLTRTTYELAKHVG